MKALPNFTRVVKCPYSIVNYENDFLICYPFLSTEDFNNFSLINMHIKKWKSIKGRGTFVFNMNTENEKRFMLFASGILKGVFK
jgi:hypothetical protein